VLSKELHIIGSSMSSHADVERAIELAASGLVDVEGIATHVLPIEQAQRGIELARSKAEGAIKVLLSFE
jgi:threonine dehydrogenase-like Zn-dependent dehydrogenase